MAKTESVEALLSPSLRVSRPVAACARCRSAKIKCDGKLPACTACERSGKAGSCTSPNDEFARGKERSYVAALEAAAQRLQKKIDAAKADNAPASNKLPPLYSPSRPPTQPRKVSGTRRREASDVNELVSDFGFLSVNATSRDFHGFNNNMSFSKILLSTAVKGNFPNTTSSRLPPRHAIVDSLEYYLKRIYVLLPFFSETELMSAVSRVYQDSSMAAPVTPLDFWYIRLVLAISNASMSSVKGDSYDQQATEHIATAMELADYVIHPGSAVGVQALLLLAEYSLLDPSRFDGWYLISMASRLVIDLGLHCEPSPETKISKEALDMRRRIFHSVYALDRLVSMSLGRPFSFTDDSATGVPLPNFGQVQDVKSPSQLFLRSLKPSLYLFDIRRVQSSFYQTTKWSSRAQWSISQATSYASSVSGDIHAWYLTIPSSLSEDHLAFFNLERLYCQILVVAPNPKLPIVNLTELNKALVFEYCVQFADELHPITKNVSYHSFLNYAEVCRAQWVGRQFLEVMWSDFDRLLKTQHVTVGNASKGVTPQENCNRAISCIRNIADTLDFASQRWDMPEIRDRFEQESAVLLGRLKNRQQEFGASPYTSSENLVSQQPVQLEYNSAADNVNPSYLYDSGNAPQSFHGGMHELQSFSDEGGYDSQHLELPNPGRQSGDFNLPPGSLPRRSYEFFGGRK